MHHVTGHALSHVIWWAVPCGQVEILARVCTFASPTFSSFLDVLLCCLVLLALEMACFLRPLLSGEAAPTAALLFAAPAILLGTLALLLSIR